MENQPSETGSTEQLGITYKIMARLMVLSSSKRLITTVAIFSVCVGIGYWLGSRLVISPSNTEYITTPVQEEGSRVVTLLEVSDLSEPQPALLSVWFIHIKPGDKPVLGFTPVAAVSMQDDPNFKLLSDFSLDSSGNPATSFLRSMDKLKVRSSGYVMVDQTSSAAWVNYLTGAALDRPLEIETHSMAEYGQVLRTMCNSLPVDAEKGLTEFPWSKFVPTSFRTSLSMSQTIENTQFLFNSSSPRCEMVPLP